MFRRAGKREAKSGLESVRKALQSGDTIRPICGDLVDSPTQRMVHPFPQHAFGETAFHGEFVDHDTDMFVEEVQERRFSRRLFTTFAAQGEAQRRSAFGTERSR